MSVGDSTWVSSNRNRPRQAGVSKSPPANVMAIFQLGALNSRYLSLNLKGLDNDQLEILLNFYYRYGPYFHDALYIARRSRFCWKPAPDYTRLCSTRATLASDPSHLGGTVECWETAVWLAGGECRVARIIEVVGRVDTSTYSYKVVF